MRPPTSRPISITIANISIQLNMDNIYILHEIESGNTARAFGTIKYLEQYPEGEKLMLSWWRR
jgi:hypothetical protein